MPWRNTPGHRAPPLPNRWPWSLPDRWWELEPEEHADERNPSAKPLAALLDARIALGRVTTALPRIDAADWDDAQYIHHRPWRIHPAQGELRHTGLVPPALEQLADPPLLHAARRQDVAVWRPVSAGP